MRRPIVLGVGEDAHSTEAVRFAFQETEERRVALEAVRAWRRPSHESADHPLLAGEPAHHHEQRAAETLEAALRDAVADHPSVELRRRVGAGTVREALLGASADAGLFVVGARRRQGHFGLQLGRVAHAVLHHSACPVAVVPQRV
jgi:nucleotide-binding universal stress UspA family protein